MFKEFDIVEETRIHHFYQFPDWITPKYLTDITVMMENNVQFRKAVLYKLLESNKDAMPSGDLDKFFGSWVYGYDVMN